MNARSYFATDSSNPIEPIEELDRVSLLKSVETEAGLIKVGAVGTVVSVYDDGVAYCVEFDEPIGALVTVLCGDLILTAEEDFERNSASNSV